MLPLQRKQAMIQFLAQKGSGTIQELGAHLGVSAMTVHRDLKVLELEGIVQKTHGGAVYLGDRGPEPAFREKARELPEVKTKLASFAVQHYVHDHAVILLEGGTTVSCMALLLDRFKELTVITNGMETAALLRPMSSRMTVLCCGGMMREVSGTFAGPLAESFFKHIHADILFLSASGFTAASGFTDPNVLESQVKKSMMAAAERTIVLLDSSKFGRRSLITTCSAGDIDGLVTDAGAPEETLQSLRGTGLEVHVVV